MSILGERVSLNQVSKHLVLVIDLIFLLVGGAVAIGEVSIAPIHTNEQFDEVVSTVEIAACAVGASAAAVFLLLLGTRYYILQPAVLVLPGTDFL